MSDGLTSAHWIGGDWFVGSSDIGIKNPTDGTLVGHIPEGAGQEAQSAVDAAYQAFQKLPWSHSPRLRANALLDAADKISAAKPELVEALVRDTGKLVRVAGIEIDAMVSEFRYYAGLARAIFGRTLEVEPGVTALLTKEPAGVAAIFTPWNAPGILLARALPAALAAGCTVVTKTAGPASFFHEAVMRVMSSVDPLGSGVCNSIVESGSDGARALVSHPDVDVISFTGSTSVGKFIMRDAASTLKRLNLELGGKAAAIVLSDIDPDDVADRLLAASLILSGQQCTALDRILVHESRFDAMANALRLRAEQIDCESPRLESSQLGPLIDIANRNRIAGIVEAAASSGNAIHSGLLPAGELSDGAFISPSVLKVEDLSAPEIQEEFFGPVVNLERFQNTEEMIAKANATRYGLASSVWSNDVASARRVARELRTGTVWINDHNKLFPEAETGGFRESGFGRLHGLEGLSEFLSTKHIYEPYGVLGEAGNAV